MIGIGALSFTTPWVLLGLLALPGIWWLVRVTPPPPRVERFPAIGLLMGLASADSEVNRSPWWLLLLRMLAAALLILALARPVLNPGAETAGDGVLFVVVDDGWAAAPGWEDRRAAAVEIVEAAERVNRPVVLLTTAPPADGRPIAALGPGPARDALTRLRQLTPKPWPSDPAAATAALEALAWDGPAETVWVADDVALDPAAKQGLGDALARLGPMTVRRRGIAPLIVLPPTVVAEGLSVTVAPVGPGQGRPVTLSALGEDGRELARGRAILEDSAPVTVDLDLPNEIRNEVSRLVAGAENSAAAVVVLDGRWQRRPVGLIGIDERVAARPLLSDLYYVEQALLPYAETRRGALEQLMARPVSALVLADVGRVLEDDRQRLLDWIEGGGVLIRFAGPRMAGGEDPLVPVRLRGDGRRLGSSLSWTEPARLLPFEETSPFYGLAVPDDVTVRRQVLAEPSTDLSSKTWARIADGTPLVTADRRGAGWIVLFHVPGNVEWSNLPLSGVFVEMLRRIVALSAGVGGAPDGRPLIPLDTLDGQGRLGPAPATALPVAAAEAAATVPGPAHPPGRYGGEVPRWSLNLGPAVQDSEAWTDWPARARVEGLEPRGTIDLGGLLLGLALFLIAVDGLVSIFLRGGLGRVRGATVAVVPLALGLMAVPLDPAAAQRQVDENFALSAVLETRLVYVRTGDAEVDAMSARGLSGLSAVLTQRTSVEPGPPLGVDVESDELRFFPLVYWPVVPSMPPLSADAIARIDAYMRTGGTVLFDTRDTWERELAATDPDATPAGRRLADILVRLDVPPLVPVPPDHVLGRAFYLMQEFPGRWTGGRVWVETPDENDNDGVSGLVIGGHDWAAVWAVDEFGRPMAAAVPGDERQRELAYRFGVNLVMYVLTGNYKSDQVHVPSILERLGQ